MLAREIRGAVDWVAKPGTLVGWAKLEGQAPGEEPVVEALLNGVVVGQGRANLLYGGNKEAIRFALPLTVPLDAAELLTGALVVRARAPRAPSVTLRFYGGLFDQLIGVHYANRQADDGGAAIVKLLRIIGGESREGILKRLRDCTPFIEQGDPRQIAGMTGREISMLGVLPAYRPPSTVKVVVGYGGHVFLEGGSNDVLELYGLHEPAITGDAVAWRHLIKARLERACMLGARFVQMIVPEKNTALAELLPYPLETPTPLLRATVAAIRADAEAESAFFDTLGHLRSAPSPADLYRKLDSHLTALGSCRVFQGILTHLGFPAELDFPYTVRRTVSGDLATHFVGLELAEYIYLPDDERLRVADAALTVVEMTIPQNGKHIGTRRIWTNAAAPIAAKVVAFGNSFFEEGTSPVTLSWWFARWFREFHFVWVPDMDDDYIREIKPDIVICQTIERFLRSVPER